MIIHDFIIDLVSWEGRLNGNRVAKGVIRKNALCHAALSFWFHFFSFTLSPIFGVLFCLLFRADAD